MSDSFQEHEKIAAGRVVALTFRVFEAGAAGEALDDTWAERAYGYIHGMGQMPAGFERALEGLVAGESFDFEVERDDAYGERNNQMVQKIEAERLPPGLKPGMIVQMELPEHPPGAPPLLFHVKSVHEGVVRLDGNHPFAGKSLRFVGQIRAVRLATAEELAAGRLKHT